MRLFLDEQYSKDEVYFYLHCRNYLMKGPTCNRTSGCCNLIDRIRYDRVSEFFEQQFFSEGEDSIGRFSSVMKKLESHVYRGGKSGVDLIDVNFVSRIALELFVLEKRVYISQLEGLYNSRCKVKSSGELVISPKSFLILMREEMAHLTTIELVELFRETWSLGQGSCNFKGFVAAINSLGYMIGRVKAKSITIDRYVENIEKVEISNKTKSSVLRSITHKKIHEETQKQYKSFLEEYSSKLHRICAHLKGSSDSKHSKSVENIMLVLKNEFPDQNNKDLPFHLSDSLNIINEFISVVLAETRVTRSVDLISGCDNDHMFKQATSSTRGMIKGFRMLLDYLDTIEYDHEEYLGHEVKKIQDINIDLMYKKAKTIAQNVSFEKVLDKTTSSRKHIKKKSQKENS